MRRRRRIPPGIYAVLVPVALVLGIYWGGHPDRLPHFARNTLVADTQGQLYQEAVDTLQRDYYRPVSKDQLLDTSVGAAITSLHDQFSHYFSPRDYGAFEDDTQGQFEGVGMTVTAVKKGLKVDQVYKGSPADRGGLHAGDVIVSVNGKSLTGKSSDQATALIKGPAGTSVRLGVRDNGTTKQLTLKREKVDIPVVESKLEHSQGKPIGWVHLSGFTAGSHGEVDTAVRRAAQPGRRRASCSTCATTAAGCWTRRCRSPRSSSRTARSSPPRAARGRSTSTTPPGTRSPPKVPVAVLVDSGSASASEIVTGALQDRKRAVVVGTRTFGKGVFQEIERLSNGGALDITVGEYFTPSGRNLGGGGVRKGAASRRTSRPSTTRRRKQGRGAAGGAAGGGKLTGG